MLDKKSISVLRCLNKLANGCTYKVVTSEEINSALPQKSQHDAETLKFTLDFLEKQDYINIKFSEENTYCYSILPKARIVLENTTQEKKQVQNTNKFMPYAFIMIASFIGTLLALLIFFYLTF